MNQTKEPEAWRVFWMMALFVVLGIPLVAVIWQTLNELLALQVRSTLWIALPALLLVALLLWFLRRTIERRNSPAT